MKQKQLFFLIGLLIIFIVSGGCNKSSTKRRNNDNINKLSTRNAVKKARTVQASSNVSSKEQAPITRNNVSSGDSLAKNSVNEEEVAVEEREPRREVQTETYSPSTQKIVSSPGSYFTTIRGKVDQKKVKEVLCFSPKGTQESCLVQNNVFSFHCKKGDFVGFLFLDAKDKYLAHLDWEDGLVFLPLLHMKDNLIDLGSIIFDSQGVARSSHDPIGKEIGITKAEKKVFSEQSRLLISSFLEPDVDQNNQADFREKKFFSLASTTTIRGGNYPLIAAEENIQAIPSVDKSIESIQLLLRVVGQNFKYSPQPEQTFLQMAFFHEDTAQLRKIPFISKYKNKNAKSYTLSLSPLSVNSSPPWEGKNKVLPEKIASHSFVNSSLVSVEKEGKSWLKMKMEPNSLSSFFENLLEIHPRFQVNKGVLQAISWKTTGDGSEVRWPTLIRWLSIELQGPLLFQKTFFVNEKDLANLKNWQNINVPWSSCREVKVTYQDHFANTVTMIFQAY